MEAAIDFLLNTEEKTFHRGLKSVRKPTVKSNLRVCTEGCVFAHTPTQPHGHKAREYGVRAARCGAEKSSVGQQRWDGCEPPPFPPPQPQDGSIPASPHTADTQQNSISLFLSLDSILHAGMNTFIVKTQTASNK